MNLVRNNSKLCIIHFHMQIDDSQMELMLNVLIRRNQAVLANNEIINMPPSLRFIWEV